MIVAQIHILPSNPDHIIQTGDVVVVALPDHPWGTMDDQHFALVEWHDPELEYQLILERANDNPFPVIAYPYHEGQKAKRTTNIRKFPHLMDSSMKKGITQDKVTYHNPSMWGRVKTWIGGLWAR